MIRRLLSIPALKVAELSIRQGAEIEILKQRNTELQRTNDLLLEAREHSEAGWMLAALQENIIRWQLDKNGQLERQLEEVRSVLRSLFHPEGKTTEEKAA